MSANSLLMQIGIGQLTTIIGANGAGKTTTLRTTMGTVRPWKGRVLLKGEDVSKLAPHADRNWPVDDDHRREWSRQDHHAAYDDGHRASLEGPSFAEGGRCQQTRSSCRSELAS